MDSSLQHPSADVYHIHRTPFFRRVHRNDSDEFERLRQAYESVRNFDEKPLAAQIKKVRLGKLLRRIKDSLTSAKLNGQKEPRTRAKTREETRREDLARARQLGMEYSRRNLNTVPESVRSMDRLDHLKDWKEEKSRLERRLVYGNTRSQDNRKKLERSQRAGQENNLRDILGAQSPPTSKKRLHALKKILTREQFIKYLVHCLSAHQLNADAMRTFREILRSRGDMYWDLVEAIDQQQQYIKSYGKFMNKLSNLAQRGEHEMKQDTASQHHTCVETFDSKTSVRPCRQSPEVFIRTYRYSDDDAFLPPPSLSLLHVHEDVVAADDSEKSRAQMHEPKSMQVPSAFSVPKKNSSHLSTKLMETIRADPTTKNTLSQKFAGIIRNTVRKESAMMLHNLELAMKH